MYIRGRPAGGLGQETIHRESGMAYLAPWSSKRQAIPTQLDVGLTCTIRGRTSINPLVSFVPINPFKLPSCDGSTTKSLQEHICRDNSTTPWESRIPRVIFILPAPPPGQCFSKCWSKPSDVRCPLGNQGLCQPDVWLIRVP